ncbi:MAG TPA: hypothetical protein ENG63_06590 [Candidatus Desulfofervidus auxilii]|uniref:Uncharacterized protein n=1 Tax=Desulfofervidus auxilii TaxID=1621989 RepID=A0A7C0Y5Q6_DESA2|nr:hypothetical protein [Candidatus Desulfofervidus auxilii]
MRLYYDNNKVVEAIPLGSKGVPSFSQRQGRNWTFEIRKIDGKEYKFYFDFTWGKCFYFRYKGRWYRLRFVGQKNIFDVKEFFTKGRL